MKPVLLACMIMLLAACGARQTRVEVTDDPFLPAYAVRGIPEHENPFSVNPGTPSRLWRLRSWVFREQPRVSHQLFVTILYQGSRLKHFTTAFDDDRRQLKVKAISKEGVPCYSSCAIREDIGMEIAEETLRQKAQGGYRVELLSKDGDSFTVTLAPAVIRDQLAETDRLSRKR